jgi:hypothetical protein
MTGYSEVEIIQPTWEAQLLLIGEPKLKQTRYIDANANFCTVHVS